MYGYPTQTIKETIDSLEMVRQLFEVGILQSGFWHQFALTAHSPIGLNPEKYKIIPKQEIITFANNDIQFTDTTGIDHSQFSYGLKKSLFNYMHGIGFDLPLQDWFDFKIPKTTIHPDYIYDCLESSQLQEIKPTAKLLWIGSLPIAEEFNKTKKGQTKRLLKLTFHTTTSVFSISLNEENGNWLLNQLEKLHPQHPTLTTFLQLKTDFESHFQNFEFFWHSKPMQILKENGLLVL
jgi:hypothetical protein